MESDTGTTIELSAETVQRIIADHIHQTRGISVAPRWVRPQNPAGGMAVRIVLPSGPPDEREPPEQQGS